MNKYVIDGLFLTQRITGIQRYAYEITRELDYLIKKDEIEILVPKSAGKLPNYQNIKIIRYGKSNGTKWQEIKWQQLDFANYLRKNKALGICLTNILPLTYRKGIIVIHDVSYKANPTFFTSAIDRLSALWHRMNYWFAAHSNMKIVTVSEFSKNEIIKYYHVASKRIYVVYSAWQHMNREDAASDTFAKFPMLSRGNYYFAMATLAKNKNFEWIINAARNNSNEIFAIAGGGKLKDAVASVGYANLPNLHLLGYVTDEDAKTLMANCKAFLFPTFYEGFGLPPLEAVACGAPRIIVSDTPCMHEIYGDYANYVNPLDYEMNLYYESKKGLTSNELLKGYSWKKSAKKLGSVIYEDRNSYR